MQGGGPYVSGVEGGGPYVAGVQGGGSEGASRSEVGAEGRAEGEGLLMPSQEWNCLLRSLQVSVGLKTREMGLDLGFRKITQAAMGWMDGQCMMEKTGRWLGNHQARQDYGRGVEAADTHV